MTKEKIYKLIILVCFSFEVSTFSISINFIFFSFIELISFSDKSDFFKELIKFFFFSLWANFGFAIYLELLFSILSLCICI